MERANHLTGSRAPGTTAGSLGLVSDFTSIAFNFTDNYSFSADTFNNCDLTAFNSATDTFKDTRIPMLSTQNSQFICITTFVSQLCIGSLTSGLYVTLLGYDLLKKGPECSISRKQLANDHFHVERNTRSRLLDGTNLTKYYSHTSTGWRSTRQKS